MRRRIRACRGGITAVSASLFPLLAILTAYGAQAVDPLNVCIIATAGWTECDASMPPSTYTGLDVELFRTAATRAGWTEGVTYKFVCHAHGAGWSKLARQLATNDTLSACAAGSGSFALTSTRQAMGLQFSYPYYRTGLGVLIETGQKEINLFAFFKPLRIEVWLAFICTIVLVPMLAWLVEQLMTEGTVLLDWDSLREAREATYESMLAVFNLTVYKVRSVSAQLLIFVFCFMVMIVMATYVANLAAALTTVSMSQRFQSISDLRGRRVASHSTYVNGLLSSYGVQATALDFDGLSTFQDLKAAFKNNTLDAYVMDLPEIGYWVMAQNDDCAVRLMKQAYGFIDFGYLFHKDLDHSLVAAFNNAMFITLESNLVEQLANKFLLFLGALDQCSSASDSDAIEFKQLAGLWIIMGGAIGFAFISCAISVLRRMYGRHATDDERKLSSVFVSGARASILRSATSQSLHGASVHGGVSNRVHSVTGVDASRRGAASFIDRNNDFSKRSRQASFFDSGGVLSVKVRPITPSSIEPTTSGPIPASASEAQV